MARMALWLMAPRLLVHGSGPSHNPGGESLEAPQSEQPPFFASRRSRFTKYLPPGRPVSLPARGLPSIPRVVRNRSLLARTSRCFMLKKENLLSSRKVITLVISQEALDDKVRDKGRAPSQRRLRGRYMPPPSCLLPPASCLLPPDS